MDNGAESYRRFLGGDEDGLTELVRDYKDGLILFLNRYVDDLRAAEELTEDTPENRAAVRSIVPLPDDPDAVVFDTVTYSRAYLESLQDKITQGMIDRTLPFVISSALDDRGNCVRVTVTTDDEVSLAKLRAYDTLGGALAQEDMLVNDAQNLPATDDLGDAEHIPAAEATNDSQSVSP